MCCYETDWKDSVFSLFIPVWVLVCLQASVDGTYESTPKSTTPTLKPPQTNTANKTHAQTHT